MGREQFESRVDISVVKIAESRIHSIVHVAHEDADIGCLVAFKPRNLVLQVAQSELIY